MTIAQIRERATEAVVGKNFVGSLTVTQRALIEMLVGFGVSLMPPPVQIPRTHPRRVIAEIEDGTL